MIQRPASDLGTRVEIGCHNFCAIGITTYLEVVDILENAQATAAYESQHKAKPYDRTSDEITLDVVKLVSI
jgi:hypothetical protein